MCSYQAVWGGPDDLCRAGAGRCAGSHTVARQELGRVVTRAAPAPTLTKLSTPSAHRGRAENLLAMSGAGAELELAVADTLQVAALVTLHSALFRSAGAAAVGG